MIWSRRARVILLIAALVAGACRFEKRPDLAAREPADTTLLPTPGGSPVEDSVRATIAAVSEAFRMGDITRVAQLTTRDAMLIDQEDEVRWTRLDAPAELPRPLRGVDDALGWESDGSTFELLADGAALVSTRYHASVSGENVPWTAVESWVLQRQPNGWRLRYLHRSRGLGQIP